MSHSTPDKRKPIVRKATGEIDYSAISVLAFDGNAFFGRLLQQIFRGVGTESVSVCEHPEEAFTRLATNRYQLVIAEWLVGAHSGLDFVRRIRGAVGESYREIPVIMVTSHTDAENVRQMRDAGVTEILVKPISPAALFSRVELVFAAPRSFVADGEYAGPDRRRRRGGYDGDDRRQRDADNKPAPASPKDSDSRSA